MLCLSSRCISLMWPAASRPLSLMCKEVRVNQRLNFLRNLWSKRCTILFLATSRFLIVQELSKLTVRILKQLPIGSLLRRRSRTNKHSNVFLQLSFLKVSLSTRLSQRNTTGWCSQAHQCSTTASLQAGGPLDQDRLPTTIVQVKDLKHLVLWFSLLMEPHQLN